MFNVLPQFRWSSSQEEVGRSHAHPVSQRTNGGPRASATLQPENDNGEAYQGINVCPESSPEVARNRFAYGRPILELKHLHVSERFGVKNSSDQCHGSSLESNAPPLEVLREPDSVYSECWTVEPSRSRGISVEVSARDGRSSPKSVGVNGDGGENQMHGTGSWDDELFDTHGPEGRKRIREYLQLVKRRWERSASSGCLCGPEDIDPEPWKRVGSDIARLLPSDPQLDAFAAEAAVSILRVEHILTTRVVTEKQSSTESRDLWPGAVRVGDTRRGEVRVASLEADEREFLDALIAARGSLLW